MISNNIIGVNERHKNESGPTIQIHSEASFSFIKGLLLSHEATSNIIIFFYIRHSNSTISKFSFGNWNSIKNKRSNGNTMRYTLEKTGTSWRTVIYLPRTHTSHNSKIRVNTTHARLNLQHFCQTVASFYLNLEHPSCTWYIFREIMYVLHRATVLLVWHNFPKPIWIDRMKGLK